MTANFTLTGKYFIQQDRSAGPQQIALMRGRILGPVEATADGPMPIYLCEIHPADESAMVIRTQTLLALAQLLQAWLYDDKVLWIEEWRQITARQDQTERQAKKRMAAARRRQQQQQQDVPQILIHELRTKEAFQRIIEEMTGEVDGTWTEDEDEGTE